VHCLPRVRGARGKALRCTKSVTRTYSALVKSSDGFRQCKVQKCRSVLKIEGQPNHKPFTLCGHRTAGGRAENLHVIALNTLSACALCLRHSAEKPARVCSSALRAFSISARNSPCLRSATQVSASEMNCEIRSAYYSAHPESLSQCHHSKTLRRTLHTPLQVSSSSHPRKDAPMWP
jgi:hypothetical protein